MEKIGIIHLHTLGFRGDDLVNFTLILNNPSKIAEIQELEHWNQKFTVATAATDGFFSRRWIGETVFGLSEEEIVRNNREMYYDRKFEAELNAVGEVAGEAAAAMAGGMAGLPEMPGGFEAGGDLPGAGEMPPPEDLGEVPGEPPEAGGEEGGPLLATPGKRDRDLKWANPDKRKKDRRSTTAPRLKSYRRMATPETTTGKTTR